MNNNLINVLAVIFDLSNEDTSARRYVDIYNKVKFLSEEATSITKDELSSKMTLEHIAALHILGAVWELNHYINVIGVYSNDEIIRNECEICGALSTLSKRGLFTGSHIPVNTIKNAGIDIPECMEKYIDAEN